MVDRRGTELAVDLETGKQAGARGKGWAGGPTGNHGQPGSGMGYMGYGDPPGQQDQRLASGWKNF